MSIINFNINGLTDEQVTQSRAAFGENKLQFKERNSILSAAILIIREPMVILLLIAATIYFVSGKISDGIFMSVAIIFQASISLYQSSRSKNALEKLKDFTQPKSSVIRNGAVTLIASGDIVIGDSLLVEEGTIIPADGKIIHSNDFSVNESTITGESLSVFKEKPDNIYSGTNVVTGLAIAEITAIGNNTQLGRIGKSIESIDDEKTPLELQINNFVKKMAIAGFVVFIVVWIINYIQSNNFVSSLLQSLTLAMSILPEEIPVAFTTFMAIGAWRLMKNGIIVKQMKTVETLGSATVICTDKTGTITENKMSIAKLFTFASQETTTLGDECSEKEKELLTIAMWASEPIPFDPMETALHKAYQKFTLLDERPHYKLIHEYPLGGKPPMMTHIFENSSGVRIVAAKGAAEAIMSVCNLSDAQKLQISEAHKNLAKEGYRILGVGKSTVEKNNYPKSQQEIQFEFVGLVAFYDPPKNNIRQVLQKFYSAGLSVKIITGDNSETTMTIANQIDFRDGGKSVTGEEVMKFDETRLNQSVMDINIFTRMFPEAKLKVINALKAQNQIVAMVGDGVNDGPALKAAHIGIAMGQRGTEIAKQAAALILLEDDLSKMVDAIAMGRKIYTNLKKAIQYIISIHIPIIATVFIPVTLGWAYPNIFSPIHIIFLELIMGPTCSIIYENEPMEENAMLQKPKAFTKTFFSRQELSISIVQGIVIATGALAVYQIAIELDYNEQVLRTMVFTVLIVANIFLTLINRSFYYSIFTTLRYKNNLIFYIIFSTVAIGGMLIFIPQFAAFFGFEQLNAKQLLISGGAGFLSVIWYEFVKKFKRLKVLKNSEAL